MKQFLQHWKAGNEKQQSLRDKKQSEVCISARILPSESSQAADQGEGIQKTKLEVWGDQGS